LGAPEGTKWEQWVQMDKEWWHRRGLGQELAMLECSFDGASVSTVKPAMHGWKAVTRTYY
jgi:hypothetical protein